MDASPHPVSVPKPALSVSLILLSSAIKYTRLPVFLWICAKDWIGLAILKCHLPLGLETHTRVQHNFPHELLLITVTTDPMEVSWSLDYRPLAQFPFFFFLNHLWILILSHYDSKTGFDSIQEWGK